ncbi:MAG: hypothetical protein AB9872_13750 [Solidesulfovibrio sp.]
MRRFVSSLALLWLLAASAALAQPSAATPAPQPDGNGVVRRQVSDARVLSTSSTCFYGPHMDEPQAKRLCAYHSRAKLLDAAVGQWDTSPAVVQAKLSKAELRAFVDSLMKVSMLHEEVRKVPDGIAVRLTMQSEETLGSLAKELEAFAANPEQKAAALAQTLKRDRLAGEARMAAVPFAGDQEFQAKESGYGMRPEAALAERRIIPGMSMTSVKELIGNPINLKQSVIGQDTYVCAGYGRIIVVYRDGAVACLRNRLDYVRRYDTDCHCAGNYATIIKSD